jgi:hypothetical protein
MQSRAGIILADTTTKEWFMTMMAVIDELNAGKKGLRGKYNSSYFLQLEP